MAEKAEAIKQCKIAYENMQNLFHEVSFFIKDVENSLAVEEEDFIIGRPRGYQVVSISSYGLDPRYVDMWPLRKLAVFFVPKAMTTGVNKTSTPFENGLKVIYVRVVLDDDDESFSEPYVLAGVMYDITTKPKSFTKFEQVLSHFESCERKVFKTPEKIDYEDSYLRLLGQLNKVNLFDIRDGEAVKEMIVDPALNLFRAHPG